jgi:2-oxoglutarate dehydrogenase E2 component (dihydrolipoamide succinyltransferase)
MARIEMVMPKMGESIMEATIIRWCKKVGDKVEQDETVLEISTDKVDSEVPSPTEGILTEILFQENAVVPVGQVIAIFETEKTNENSITVSTPTNQNLITEKPSISEIIVNEPQLATAVLSNPIPGRFYSPLVLSIAKEEGISMSELETIPGTGKEDRVTKKDILNYLEAKKSGKLVQHSAKAAAKVVTENATVPETQPQTYSSSSSNNNNNTGFNIPKKSFSFSGDYEIIEMDRMRKMIAENMVYSKHVSPHVTSFVEADVTNIVLWREKVKKSFEKKYNEKLTYTPIFVWAVAKALRDFPMVNISVDEDKIILKKNINIGIAVALPSGNLIVPVLKNADRLNLAGLAAGVNDLANRARNNKLTPDDLANGTYSISNVGTFGNVMGTPVILQPQCAILATGAIRKKPAVIETPQGDVIGIRHFMFLSHSYDHRVIDGALGGAFVRKVADYLEAWDLNLEP